MVNLNPANCFPRRIVECTLGRGKDKKILSEVVELVPKGDTNKLSETVYKEVFSDGRPTSGIKTRSVYSDPERGTRTVFYSGPNDPAVHKPRKKTIEVTDRSRKVDISKGYGYGDENMRRVHITELSDDGKYIARQYSASYGANNVPNYSGSRTDIYNPNEYLHYVDGQLYSKGEPHFYFPQPITRNSWDY